MNKELEALELSKDNLTSNGEIFEYTKEYKTIKQALTELKAIKEAKPSEALECLEKAKNRTGFPLNETFYPITEREATTIKQALLKAQEFEKAYADVKALPLESLIETYKKDVVLDIFTKEIEQLKTENAEYKKVLEILLPLMEVIETPVKKYRYLKINGVVVYTFGIFLPTSLINQILLRF